MTTKINTNNNKHITNSKNDNNNYIDNIHEIIISLDKNDNIILNNCKISQPNLNNNDNTNHTYKNYNTPITRDVSPKA